ncbi:MAG: MBL fold metallo-hydrolase [Gemmatimonadota bacterium]
MPTEVDGVPTLSMSELRERLEQGEPVTVVDVRTSAARAEWSVPGSLHVDAMDALRSGTSELLDRLPLREGAPVVAVCNAGNSSKIATRYLRSRGVPAFSLAGGMRAWSLAWNVAEVALPARGAGAPVRVLQVRRTGKGCLSYLIGSAGEGAVIDPSVDPQVYEDLARDAGWRIGQVLETHVHADHLSRARVLAGRTGAVLRLPRQQRVRFPFETVSDGDEILIGDLALAALRVPGHTDESTAYVLEGAAAFTGDTLFPGAVGRPDLEGGPEEARQRARDLYASVRRLLDLPDGTRVLAAHTSQPVAFDGVPVSATIDEVRPRVEALGSTEDEFVERVVSRIPQTPPNHLRILELNEAGELPDFDPVDLEAGANRCAAG